jgi:acyl carrier protein
MMADSVHPAERRRYEIRMESTAELRENLKRLIVERLNLIDVTPADIGDDMPLFKTGLGLDSIDALELTLNVEREYGVKVANSEQALKAFQSVAKLADFIEARRQAVV